MISRDEIISQTSSLPQIPAPVARIMTYLGKPDADLNTVASFIEYDPGLTVNVLRMANSSFFGGGGAITTVKDALFRLGMRRIVQMVIASGVAPNARGPVSGYGLARGELLRFSIAIGVAAELVAAKTGIAAPDYTFTAGLLSNIGKVVMGKFLEMDPGPVLSLAAKENVSFEQAERTLFGIDHAELGAILLKRWELPEPIVTCVRWHLDPCSAPAQDVALDLVHVGRVLATMAGIGQGVDGLSYHVCQASFDRLKLTPEAATASMEGMVSGLEEIEAILGQV
ncbi:HDOD domain-containing protein [Fundidesulfovibrio terrae]|uniref:HDOD domain-containing protein n=1 Tax=Fundidesulfovibrio terrae TaxID=2922866 RepID=UPI001FAF11F1|nr:HDOD domain-containing protein [Fundidesulfovibrio terrae]